MDDCQQYRNKKTYSPDINNLFVRTLSGQIPADGKRIEIRPPQWVRERLNQKGNMSRYILRLILQDFAKDGINEPINQKDQDRLIFEISDIK